MTVFQPNTIDSVTEDGRRGLALLSIVIPGRMINQPALIEALQEKVNRYVGWIQAGQLPVEFPQMAGLIPTIVIASQGPISDWAHAIFGQIAEQIEAYGIGLLSEEIPLAPPQRSGGGAG